LLEPARRLLHDLRVEPQLFSDPIVHVPDADTGEPIDARRELRELPGLAPQILESARHEQIDQRLAGCRTAARRIRLLTANERPLVKAAPEVLRRLEHVIDVRNQSRPEAGRLEDLTQRVLLLGDWSPARRDPREVPLQLDVSVVEGVCP